MNLFRPYLAVLSSLFSLIPLDANAQQPASFPSSTNDVGVTPEGDFQSGELERVIVTGYVVPRVDDGPAPVTLLDNNYAQRRGQPLFKVSSNRCLKTSGHSLQPSMRV